MFEVGGAKLSISGVSFRCDLCLESVPVAAPCRYGDLAEDSAYVHIQVFGVKCVDGRMSRFPDGYLILRSEARARDLVKMMHGC